MSTADWSIRDGLERQYADVYTPRALAALRALSHLDAKRVRLMAERTERRLARAEGRRPLAFLDPASTIPGTNLTVQQANPHLHLVGLEQVQVVRGIRLTEFSDNPSVLYLEGERVSERDRPRFELKLKAADGTLHYRAQAELCSEAASPSIAP